MARKDSDSPWGEEYEQMIKRSMLNLDEYGNATKSTPKPKMSKSEMKGKDAAKIAQRPRQEAIAKFLRELKKGRIPSSPTR